MLLITPQRFAAANRRRGVAMLEFAIVLPLLLMLLLGIMEMGRVMMLNQVATNAVREAARRAIIRGTTTQQVQAIINGYLDNAGVSADGRQISITDEQGGNITLESAAAHQAISVSVQFPYAGNTWGFTRIMGENSLVSQATMRRE